MTTDTFPKLRLKSYTSPDGKERRLLGMAKGAGMIHPRLDTFGSISSNQKSKKSELHATLLSFLITDAPIKSRVLRSSLDFGVQKSFNSISVDGDTSTNDTVLVMANGASGGNEIEKGSIEEGMFNEALGGLMQELSELIVRDGEGATKFVKVVVKGSPDEVGAHAIASTISRSPLVKTALFGRDANWGRILCSVGYSSLPSSCNWTVDPTKISVSIKSRKGEVKLLGEGQPLDWDEGIAKGVLEEEDLEVLVDLGIGHEESCYWTCDFSHEYISINADYRS